MNKKLYLILQWTLIFFIACNPPVASEDEEVDPISNVIFSYLQEDEQVFISASIKDPFNGDSLVSVALVWYGTGGFEQTEDIVPLVDNGNFGDILSSDGVYSRKLSSTGSDGYFLNQPLTYEDSGKVYLTIRAQYEVQGEVSVSDSFHLGNINPEILFITVPDTIEVPASDLNYDTLMVSVADANGLDDISWVGYRSLKPDSGYANNGNFIYLYDDGGDSVIYDDGMITITSGDSAEGDGIYSYVLVVYPNVVTGTYHWTFQASDLNGAMSDTVHQKVIVK